MPWIVAIALLADRRRLAALGGRAFSPRLGNGDGGHAGGARMTARRRSALTMCARTSARPRSSAASTWTSRRGERHAMIGPNGAGKTTLFNLICGRFPITSGEIHLDGRRIDALPPHRINRLGLSRSFQITSIFHRLTVFENLRCALLWSRGYRYSFWHLLPRQRGAERGDRETAGGPQPGDAARRAGGLAVLRGATRAGDRHDDRRRGRRDPAGRTHRRHEPQRDGICRGADPPRHRRARRWSWWSTTCASCSTSPTPSRCWSTAR